MPLTASIAFQEPPLPGVATNDVVWLADSSGKGRWLRVLVAGRIDGHRQQVIVVAVGNEHIERANERNRWESLDLPLDKAIRRVFVPIEDTPPTTRGVAKVPSVDVPLPRRK